MRRLSGYLVLILVAGLGAAVWFVATEDVDPAASDPGDFGLILAVTVVAALGVAARACVVIEGLYRLVRYGKAHTQRSSSA